MPETALFSWSGVGLVMPSCLTLSRASSSALLTLPLPILPYGGVNVAVVLPSVRLTVFPSRKPLTSDLALASDPASFSHSSTSFDSDCACAAIGRANATALAAIRKRLLNMVTPCIRDWDAEILKRSCFSPRSFCNESLQLERERDLWHALVAKWLLGGKELPDVGVDRHAAQYPPLAEMDLGEIDRCRLAAAVATRRRILDRVLHAADHRPMRIDRARAALQERARQAGVVGEILATRFHARAGIEDSLRSRISGADRLHISKRH